MSAKGKSLFFRKKIFRDCFIAIVLSVAAIPFSSFAQKEPPQDFRRELSKAKAERFALMYLAEASQTQNQTLYDVIYYDLDLDIDPTAETVSGSVTMTAEVVSDSLAEAELNLLNNMTVSQVTWAGGPLGYAHSNDILTVTLPMTYYLGETFTIVIYYSGTPSISYGAFGFDTYGGDPMIWSLSEPYGSRSWWPCKDIPSDKADSVDIRITVPDTLIVASNGTLRSETDNGSTKTYWWHEEYPITTYLVSVAIHPYTVFSHWYHYSLTDSMEVRYYVFPDHYDAVQENYGKTVGMMELFSDLFGEYPFINEKYGHAEFIWGGGMEHQTITSLGWWGEYLIAHELAHQWWGDMVTCNSFHHIWMNEGFATYSEALYSEFTYSMARYHSDMAAAKYLGGGTIYVPDPSDWARVFHSGLSYNKGSWVLHMLRHVVGDSTFFQILKTYYADARYQYGTATTEQFRDVCEDESGMDLDFFFHQWIYEEYYPTYKYNWSYLENGGQYEVSLDIEQLQSNYIFKMPIDITFEAAFGETTLVVWDSLATQSFNLVIGEEPLAIFIDKDEWILRDVVEPITNPTFARGILLVNGVDFNTYGSSIWTAYEDSAFWGSYDISFWDCFDETGLGYPSNLPPPLGHGSVPPDTIKQFSTVIWVGNNYLGDLSEWYDTPIMAYLQAGGNVLLMGRDGQSFVLEPLRTYLGITWREESVNTINDCISAYPGLVDIGLIGTQSYCAVFDTSLATMESALLFSETTTFSTHRGLGVWRKPADGGTHRLDGAQFVFISGRPYRYDHDALRSNVEFILGDFFGEPYDPLTGAAKKLPKLAFHLEQNYPNPFNPVTNICFTIPEKSHVSLKVFDVTGRLIDTIVAKEMKAGTHTVTWDGTDRREQTVASGVYFYKIVAGSHIDTKKMVLIR
ncbi:MAG: T9SS type A sorting domain-containing protein [Candidatus Latescibacteria bacterium]|nr:T9SS type A sorting domain-containing protein [Candidatus Latescibacterota bacterium]NIM66312.1 T9SS type A sorting domain-containing protein [Candidatus Latescibacterota bacterium]NIO02791.1 T9SS type A sorting domain-containing protein [Candidatus Latescibacterota bacterium]NIO29926.1 T9SS type A sorting domain-containing protein [Candidatus Latescibacterota bacterium]NIO57541.1 T9SS type A sorting domain-containing protein [Candidatus Latescibacterota bacterium]